MKRAAGLKPFQYVETMKVPLRGSILDFIAIKERGRARSLREDVRKVI
jgi:hypothetical protein